ncbi:hypothetical protein D3C73_1638000 [compost metagenome]
MFARCLLAELRDVHQGVGQGLLEVGKFAGKVRHVAPLQLRLRVLEAVPADHVFPLVGRHEGRV